jgi:hypothetical protein
VYLRRRQTQPSLVSFVHKNNDVVRARNARFVLIRDGYDDRVAILKTKRFESEVDFLRASSAYVPSYTLRAVDTTTLTIIGVGL